MGRIGSGFSRACAKIPEYRAIVQNHAEHRWKPSELSGGIFSEIVFTILDGYPSSFASTPFKPANMVDACKSLESRKGAPRSFQILIPRALPVLYEVRNNRGVGHVAGDVDSNSMDAALVLSMSSWILAELIRVFHSLKIDEAQRLVNSLSERRIPLVWQGEFTKRVLNPQLSIADQMLVLIASESDRVDVNDLFKWLDYKDRSYFRRTLRKFHDDRYIDLAPDGKSLVLLPPGSGAAAEIVAATV